MSSLRLRRLIAVLGLAGWIALVPVAANAAEPFHLLQSEGGLLAEVWGFLAGLLGVEGTVDATTATDGAPALDQPPVDNGEHGATVDPNGRT